jgi:hypothetical protein
MPPRIFYLPNNHPEILDLDLHVYFYTKDWSQSSIVQVPPHCAPVCCEYTGDLTDGGHSWTNPISGQVYYETHPFGLTKQDGSFYDGFYEITEIQGLTFKEGESWCPDTNQKIHVVKTDGLSIWNPFFQRYDQPCNENKWECDSSPRVFYGSSVSTLRFGAKSIEELLENDMTTFLQVYCKCCVCQRCKKIHDYSCNMEPATSIRVAAVVQSTNMQEVD